MSWIDRLQRAPHLLKTEEGAIEILSWNYSWELADNVPHRHTFYEVCQVGKHGAAEFLVEGARHRVGAGDVFFARPGEVHQILNRQKRGMELRWVSWTWKPSRGDKCGEIATLMDKFALSKHRVNPRDRRVQAAWNALQIAAESPPQMGANAQIAASALALILAIAQSGAPAATVSESVSGRADAGELLARSAVRYISDNLDGQLSLETIASHLYISSRHLSRVLQEFTGASPGAYIEQARLHHAAHLLSQSSQSIKEIAAGVGYQDVHHFTRRFAARFGVPPGRFRSSPENYVRIVQKPGDLV